MSQVSNVRTAWPQNVAKQAMVVVTIGWFALGFLVFLLGWYTALDDGYLQSDGRRLIGEQMLNTAGLHVRGIMIGFLWALATAPLYFLAISICFVAWFATKPGR